MITKIDLFRGKKVRKTTYDNEWWFVVEDVIAVLTDSADSKQYLQRMRKRDPELEKGYVQFVRTLDVDTKGGKQKMVCANIEGIFRIIQSITSPKVEPFKLWLAKVGYERVKEIEDPELGMKRTRALYKAKGYPGDWIEKRMRGVAIRDELTSEWKNRGVVDKQYGILTGEIAKASLGVLPSEHKKIKNLKVGNLRDHMTDLELIFSMLGERATTEIARAEDSQGFDANKLVAQEGGSVAGKARRDLEKKTGKKVVSSGNFLEKEKEPILIEGKSD